jgi:hypothetical protein
MIYELYISRASAASSAKHCVIRTTMLSYGNTRFLVICPAETVQPIKMKFCTNDNVGEVTRSAKDDWNRLAKGGPTDRWNITSKTFLATITSFTLLYLTLPYLILVCFYSPNSLTDLHTYDGSNDAIFCIRKCHLGVALIWNYISGLKVRENPKFSNLNAKFPAKSIHSHNFWTIRDKRKI